MLASPAAILFVLVAILPAAAPRGPIPTGVIAAPAVCPGSVNTGFDGTQINVWRLSGLAILIYVIHAGCAFAAVLPYDASCRRGCSGRGRSGPGSSR